MNPNGNAVATIQCDVAAKLNFACHQSAFAFLRELRIENNDSSQRLENVQVTLYSNPAFLKPKIWTLDRIAPAGIRSVTDRDINLDGAFLLNLADSISGHVTITVEHDGLKIAEETKPVELLAYNEWGGAGYMPELLAAFSMPNDPAVDHVLRDASLILREAGKPDQIDGYQSRSRQRVWEIASAIYTAVCNLGVTYSMPPASFERDGQKIRLPGQILENRVATCLDTTMLFASVLEQAGLKPIVALPRGHALAGVWLQPEELSMIVSDEAEVLRKRIQLKELLLFETTFATQSPAPPFSKAVKAVENLITPDEDDTFSSIIDIHRAREHKILPLGKTIDQTTGAKDTVAEVRVEIAFEEAPVLPDFDEGLEEDKHPESPDGRLERWQRKLLDLSARNPLLNHRSTKASRSSLILICPQPGRLEDKLADGARIKIDPFPQPTGQAQDEELHFQRTGEDIKQEFARDALEKKQPQVLVDMVLTELSKSTVSIYRKAQTALQEGGANTLYLALGFLLWKRDEKDSRRFRAPLILVPVTLIRNSVRSGVRMLKHDDEPRFNTTLLEMLRKDFHIDIQGFDDALPEDLNGVDVDGVWNKVRKAVKNAPGFEVVEDVVLGHFSFAKYLMWKDLKERTEALRSSSIVKHLMDTPRDPYSSEIDFVDAADIDRRYKPSDLLAPLPADSSQMAAIATADAGKDFVIIGPPGTGKSQTIGNLIAHLLGKDKKVLFVSEKTAALEVVYRRLKDIGLGQFALELHSNKARKSDVLSQLRSAWEFHTKVDEAAWKKKAERLRDLRDRLNLVVGRLHTRHRNGLIPFEAMGVRIRDEDLAGRVTLSWPTADHHDESDMSRMREVVANLQVQAEAVGDISNCPFEVVGTGEWSPKWQGNLLQKAGALSAAALAMERECENLLDRIGICIPDRTMARVDALAELAETLGESWRTQAGIALGPDGHDRIEVLDKAAQHLHAYTQAQSELSCRYDPMAWRKLDGEDIACRWREADESWLIKRLLIRRKVLKEMKDAGAQGKPEPQRDSATLCRLREHGEAIDQLGEHLSDLKIWQGHSTPPDALEALSKLGKRARSAVDRLADDAPSLIDTRSKIKTLLLEGNDLLASESAVGRVLGNFLQTSRKLQEVCGEFESLADGSVREYLVDNDKALEAIREITESIVQHQQELKAWCDWRRRRTQAMDLQLAPLVTAVENGAVPVKEIENTFEAAYCTWWSEAIIGEDKVLCRFSTPEHVANIKRFREIDDQFQKLTAAYIAAKLAGRLPKSDSVAHKSSWGVLRHELQKKRRHIPVRQLMAEIPDVVTALSPCLMMSPLSVAQYLSTEQDLFDVVIFDEASQITVWDAIGCLARARQTIVVGDPKQMPPTNFFARADDDPDGDIDMEGDLESILDEMLGASIPERTLGLHYRSRKESLIAFSNSRYYDNQLVTFPAPIYPDKGVRLIRPDGFYARGKARHNQGEAEAIVAEILRRLKHEELTVRRQSIGVVTFNTEQQSLIEDLLDRARSTHPDIEWAFDSESGVEPVFVKNLETVQGDERDVILFSVTYGPDQAGHVTMNFGPLNRDGGERRLNVAISRSRSEMVVFSTLSPDRIDLSRTQALAVADLKHFLEFAERGPASLGAAVQGSLGDFESPFETAVARALGDKGWKVHPQVGVSAYRIDLGIVHPDAPGAYLAGVECDGAMYHSSAFARERDKIRQEVLEGLGWTLFRVWSTDWWTHKAKALESLHNSLTNRLQDDRRKREEAASAIDERKSTVESTTENSSISGDNQPVSAPAINMKESQSIESELPHVPQNRFAHYSDATETFGDTALRPPLMGDSNTKYVITDFDDSCHKPDPEQFHTDEYSPRLCKMIDCVIDTEGPIHQEVLVRRIARHHGFRRAGRQIRERVLSLAKGRRGRTKESVGMFFWSKGTVKERRAPARYSGRDDEMRNVEYICGEEIEAIRKALALDGDPVVFARHIGIARLSKQGRQRLMETKTTLRPETTEQEREKRERIALLDPWRKMAVEAQYSKLMGDPPNNLNPYPAVLRWMRDNLDEWVDDIKPVQTKNRVWGVIDDELRDLEAALMMDNFARTLVKKLWGQDETLSSVMKETVPPDRIFSEVYGNNERVR